MSLLDILENFNLLRPLELVFFCTFISKNLTSFSQKKHAGWNYKDSQSVGTKNNKNYVFVQFSTLTLTLIVIIGIWHVLSTWNKEI